MFGLEDENKKKGQEFVFELEKELKDKKKHNEVIALVEDRIQKIKKILRSGATKEEFDLFGRLLHGYTSLLKVTTRVPAK